MSINWVIHGQGLSVDIYESWCDGVISWSNTFEKAGDATWWMFANNIAGCVGSICGYIVI